MRSTALLLAASLLCPLAWGQSVALNGTLGDKALLIVDGSFPKSVAVGATHMGVKVVSVQAETVVVEIAGKKLNLRVGEAPASVGSSAGLAAGGSRVVLAVGPGGHFTSEGQINGRIVRFMLDTGATAVSIGVAEADRIGLKYKNGDQVQMNTANGVVPGWRMTLDSVRLGDVLVSGVDAVITPAAMPYVLLGNSFLGRFQMNRTNDQMVLEKRY
ncbi:retropepsin-like aspartic protease [Rhodoferax sp.]|uniref:retropepsin-like aspartic protease family protein n=1 Tax=Rhodoferax sp. TaxID=50421 RepID=UPI0025E6C668|nr:retropepsin-like aspartic protease [Rhodoferax sp.]